MRTQTITSIVDLEITGATARHASRYLVDDDNHRAIRIDYAGDGVTPREDLSETDVAEAMIAGDEGLLRAVAYVDWFGSETETVARCGFVRMLVQSPELRRDQVLVTTPGRLSLQGFRPVQPSPEMIEAATGALRSYLEDIIRAS